MEQDAGRPGRGPGENWERGAAVVICLGAGLFALWLAFRYAIGVALPFLLAWLLSLLVRPPVRWICTRWRRVPRGLMAGVAVTVLVGGTMLLSVRGIRRGVSELGDLVAKLVADGDGVVSVLGSIRERLHSASEHIPFLRRFEDLEGYAGFSRRMDELVASGVDRLVASVGSRLPGAAMSVAGRVPEMFVFLTILLVACYYFCADDGRLGRSAGAFVRRLLPGAWRDAAPALGRRLRRMGRQYLRACLILGLLTFLEVFVGLTLLRVPYAFLLSWIIAVVDFLPLLGAGTVLIPWAAICLLLGNVKLGVGLLILYAVCTVVRQVAEPRMIGESLGLHPILSLVAMYAGLRLFGLWGMILAPFLLAMAKGLLDGGEGEVPRPQEGI